MIKLLAETWISSQGKSIALKRELSMWWHRRHIWPMKYLDVFDVSSLMIQNVHQPCIKVVQTCCEYCFPNRPDICSDSGALFLLGNCLQLDKWSSFKGHKTESCHGMSKGVKIFLTGNVLQSASPNSVSVERTYLIELCLLVQFLQLLNR